MADPPGLTGVLLVGGASRRFGSPKALARLDGETLAERAWRLLGEVCDERLAVGKAADGLELPFPLLDDGSEVRASLAGLVAGLRAAAAEVAVVLPVDTPLVDAASLRALAAACRDAAVPPGGPLPGAYRRRVLPLLERRLAAGELRLRDAVAELDAAVVDLDPALLENVNAPADLERLRARAAAPRFEPQPHLVGRLLELRPLREDDFAALRAVASDPLLWAQHPEPDRHRDAPFRAFFDEQLGSGGALVAVDRGDGSVVGMSRFHGYDAWRSEVEIGWTFLARSRWGGAYNGELKRLMLEHAFRFVERVVLLVQPANARSRRAVEKLGAVRVGTRLDGAGRPSLVYELRRPG